MLKKDARTLLNQRAAIHLNVFEIALLKELLTATYVPEPTSQIELCAANISVPTLADRVSLSDRTVQYNLRKLEQKGLIKRNEHAGKQNTYTLTLVQITEWPLARVARAEQRKQQRENDAFMRRFVRSLTAEPELPSNREPS
jgi:DNA-binding MarR family transcriptional regulator